MASTVPTKSMVTRFRSARRKLNEQNIKTLAQLLNKPNITISKTTTPKKLNVPSKKVENKEHIHKVKPLSPKGLKILGLVPETTLKKELIKSPPTLKNKEYLCSTQSINKEVSATSKKVVQVSRKVVKRRKRMRLKSMLVEPKEFYPNVQKRNAFTKKVLLKPKKSYKVVASMNKRKRRIPQREMSPVIESTPKPNTPPSSPVQSPTMQDLIEMVEDQGLEDEDFLEILTCPSPVWWEDMEFDEIEKEYARHKIMTEKINTLQENSKDAGNISAQANNLDNRKIMALSNTIEKSLKTVTNKIQEKKSKLESILDNLKIKNKVVGAERSFGSETSGKERKISSGGLSDVSINEEDLINTLENLEIPIKDVDYTETNKIVDVDKAKVIMSKIVSDKDTLKASNEDKLNEDNLKHAESELDKDNPKSIAGKSVTTENTRPRNIKYKSYYFNKRKAICVDNNSNDQIERRIKKEKSAESDLNLEQSRTTDKDTDSRIEEIKIISNKNIDSAVKIEPSEIKTRKRTGLNEKISKSVANNAPADIDTSESLQKISDIDLGTPVVLEFDELQVILRSSESSDSRNTPKHTIPTKALNSINNIASRMESAKIDIIDSSKPGCDSISDFNIKYLDECEDITDGPKIKTESDSSDFVTIYKIIGGDSPDGDIEDEINACLLCKTDNNTPKSEKVKRRKRKVKKVKVDEMQVDTLGESKVKVLGVGAKYCHKCSSIFDSESCQYCLKLNNKSAGVASN